MKQEIGVSANEGNDEDGGTAQLIRVGLIEAVQAGSVGRIVTIVCMNGTRGSHLSK